ncbi:cutinase family protein [Nocardia sp. NPDC050710]|uniref:cutinase family protein n=1 Tax=Nocardia sp. NPDC050710 TaxID=3157220 RepID=UPI0033EC7216
MTRAARTVVTVLAAATAAATVMTPTAAVAAPGQSDCPALLAIGVQGPGQAAADAANTTDSGLLGEVLRPLAVGIEEGSVDRVYVRFQPELAGVSTSSGSTPYDQSVERGLAALNQTASEFLARCRSSSVAVAGYSHGAQVASLFAQQVGRGGGIAADRVAAVALFGDPTRAPNTPALPGASGQAVPDPAPGTAGEAVKQLVGLVQQPNTGGGISPNRNSTTDFGRLARRVASFCVAGDLACDTPEKAPILTVVSNIVGAANDSGGDPLRALASVSQALAFTAIKTVTNVVNNDVSGNSLASLSLSSRTSLSERLAEASDPRTPLDINNVLKAVMKIGTIALNAVVTVAKAVITPTNLAEIAAAGLANPAAGLAVLGQKLVGALPQLVPPATASRLVGQAFQSVVSTVTDNSGLIDTATWVRYSDAIARRGSYVSDPVTTGGQSAVRFTTDWFSAIARDLATATPAPSSPANPPASNTPSPSNTGSSTTTAPPPTATR